MENKLNLGSGERYIKGFVNIDYCKNTNPDLILDIGKEKLPFEANSVDLIVTNHLLEHLTKKQGIFCLKECFRVLKKGGEFYIGIPDLAEIARIYTGVKDIELDFEKSDAWLIDAIFETQRDKTLIHKYGYTSKTIRKLLTEIGFKEKEQLLPLGEWVKFNDVPTILNRWGTYTGVWTK